MFLKRPIRKNWKNVHAKGRKTGAARTTYHERRARAEIIPPPPPKRGKRDYLAANCVVLAAAVFGPQSKQWAEDMLPMARAIDGRMRGNA